MKTTGSKDLVKVDQILPIMQEYFGKSMNLARIKLMAYMLHALCVVQTVSLHKLASTMPTSIERDSNLRRIQRFIANYALNLDLVARTIFTLLPVKLTLGITYKGVAFPLLFSLLDKRGNSNWEERKDIMERFIRLFGHDCIDCLVADREFIGKEWIGWLNDNRIRYYIRIRLYLAGSRIKNSDGIPELQILVCFNRPEDGVATYKKRWEIETAFRAMKSSGFNIEDTLLRDRERIARLFAMVCMALVWAYLVGEHKDIYVKPIKNPEAWAKG